jgi:hypothetical protein
MTPLMGFLSACLLLVCCLFNYTIYSSEYTESNGMMNSEQPIEIFQGGIDRSQRTSFRKLLY